MLQTLRMLQLFVTLKENVTENVTPVSYEIMNPLCIPWHPNLIDFLL